MWTTRWPGFTGMTSELNRMREEMDRVFGGASGNGGRLRGRGYPQLNIWEDDDHLFVESEMPGLELDEIEIFINGDDQLTIQGERKQPQVENGAWHRRERGFGNFSRLVRLTNEVDAEKVTAEMKDGVLTIKMPKKEEAKPRRIQVKSPR